MKCGNCILAEKGSFFYICKAIIFKYSAGSSRIDARTGETMPGKVNLHIYAGIVSSEAILKLPLKVHPFLCWSIA